MNTNGLPHSAVGVAERHQLAVHAYRPANGASRSPCPGLNTLANHSYLPHDGRNITFHKLVSALRNGMGFSPGLAIFMAIGGFTLLRRPSLAPFDLHGTARHNFIEHNASMVHDDARHGEEYAPCSVDLKLLNEFLATAHPSEHLPSEPNGARDNVITGQEIAAHRVKREAESLPVDALHAELGRAEFAIVMEIFGKGMDRELDRAELEVFLKENRMPDGWVPSHTTHLWEAVARSATIRQAMNEVRGKMEGEPAQTHDEGVFEWFKSVVKKLSGHGGS